MSNLIELRIEDFEEEEEDPLQDPLNPSQNSKDNSPNSLSESETAEQSAIRTSQPNGEEPPLDTQEVVTESVVKKKRGRPAGKTNSSFKKVSSGRGRGRPPGFTPTRAISNGLEDETTSSENQYEIMEERLAFELTGQSAKDVSDLTLDNAKSPDANFLRTKNFTNLKFLSLINCGLRFLDGFPSLPALKILVLNGNRLTGDLNFLSRCEKLEFLDLSENLIRETESLIPLKWLKKLRALFLMSNPVTFVDGFRTTVFSLIPSLQDLDGIDSNGNPITKSVFSSEKTTFPNKDLSFPNEKSVSDSIVTPSVNGANDEAMDSVMILLQGGDQTTGTNPNGDNLANTSGLADLGQFLIL